MNKRFVFSRYILIVLCFFGATATSFSQVKEPYEMTVRGVKVIVQPSGNEILEIQTVIKGGVQNYGPGKQGIEALAMNALTECGTAKDDKNSFKDKLDRVSANVYGFAGKDYSKFIMNCIKSDFETVWPLYVDALTTPRFDPKEFDRIRQDAINNLKAQESSPDYSIDKMATQIAFAGKNYAKFPEGTEATLKSLQRDEVKNFYTSILTKSRLVIVVVGDLDKDVIEKKVSAMLESVPEGKPFMLKKEAYVPKAATLKTEKKDFATNYVEGVTGGPVPGSPDYNAFMVAMRIFYDRHFLDVRTKNGLSYAPITYFAGGASPSSRIVVSTTDPNKYIGVLNGVIDKVKKEGFTPEEVKDLKTVYLTNFYYRNETNSAQASALASNEVLHNNWRRSVTIRDDIKKLTVQQVNEAFNKYITNITWAYQGDPAKVNPTLYTQNKLNQPLPKSKITIRKNG